jgi:hypothetical protein
MLRSATGAGSDLHPPPALYVAHRLGPMDVLWTVPQPCTKTASRSTVFHLVPAQSSIPAPSHSIVCSALVRGRPFGAVGALHPLPVSAALFVQLEARLEEVHRYVCFMHPTKHPTFAVKVYLCLAFQKTALPVRHGDDRDKKKLGDGGGRGTSNQPTLMCVPLRGWRFQEWCLVVQTRGKNQELLVAQKMYWECGMRQSSGFAIRMAEAIRHEESINCRSKI